MNTEKKEMNKKKKITIAVIAVVVIGAAVTAGVLLQNPLKVKNEAMTVEFGQPISTAASDYLKKDVDKDIVKKTEVTYKAKPVEGQSYDQIGEYKVTLTYEKKTAEVMVTVKDTTKPQFNATAEAGIDTIEGVELNFAELITATDLSGAEVTFDTEGVDLTKAGTYTLKAVAKDGQGNKAKKDIAITVAEKPANMSGSSVSVDPATGKVSVSAKTYNNSSGRSGGGSGGSGNTYVYNGPMHDRGYINGESGNTWSEGDWVPLPEGW